MRMYPDGGYASIGQRRWELKWYVMKPGVCDKIDNGGDFDPDNDQYAEVEHFKFEDHQAAQARAQQVCNEWNKRNLAMAIVTVQEQVAEWFERDMNLGQWTNVGEAEYFDEPVAPPKIEKKKRKRRQVLQNSPASVL